MFFIQKSTSYLPFKHPRRRIRRRNSNWKTMVQTSDELRARLALAVAAMARNKHMTEEFG
jgi:hypothetical protein